MVDYLATTSLGDLARKTKGAEAFNEAGNNTSSIRSNIGEINQ
jgi:hypothetical protein